MLKSVAVLGAGLSGCCAALKAAQLGYHVTIYDKHELPIQGASLHNEGKLHLGYVYGADPQAETHEVMIKGSLSFLNVLSKLTGIDPCLFDISKPFVYGVPHDSQLSFDAQVDHFRRVDKTIIKIRSSMDDSDLLGLRTYQPSEKQSRTEFASTFNPKLIAGSLQTDEISVDTSQVAKLVGASVMANSAIELKTAHHVKTARRLSDNTYQIELNNGVLSETRYIGVMNCLWEDRVRLDRSVGIEPPRPWLVRYKAAISGRLGDENYLASLPSATLITGAYGDIVNHGDGRFYLSWYPKCKLGESQNDSYPEIEARIKTTNAKQLVKQSIESMGAYIPSIKKTIKYDKSILVGGGYIFAWGKSDITDPDSKLHQRHLIGPDGNENWISVNTGKYCTAPMFGVEAAERLHEQLN